MRGRNGCFCAPGKAVTPDHNLLPSQGLDALEGERGGILMCTSCSWDLLLCHIAEGSAEVTVSLVLQLICGLA